MVQNIFAYFAAHPGQLTAVLVAIVLAGIGLWYVISHHLQVIVITLLCSGGVASGIAVLYHGAVAGARDLLVIGLFLVAVFPVIFVQALRLSAIAAAAAKTSASHEPARKLSLVQRRDRAVSEAAKPELRRQN